MLAEKIVSKLKWIISGLRKRGFIGLLELLFSPVLIPLYTIPFWGKFLWNSRILLWGQWSRYQSFYAHNAINNLFYRTQWINLNRYGRLAKSPIIGLGNFPLSNWWHLSLVSSYIFANAGAITVFSGTFVLIFSNLIWLNSVAWQSVLLVFTIVLFSSSTVMLTFQNYQILGWMWLPIAFYGLINNHMIIATIGFSLAGLFGITSLVVSTPIIIAYLLVTDQLQFILILIPAFIIVFTNFIPIIRTGGLGASIRLIGKMIGLIHVNVHYKRKSMNFSLMTVYLIFLYGFSIFLIWFGTNKFPLLLSLSYTIFILNQRFFRFADLESLIIMMIIMLSITIFSSPLNGYSILSLILAANPLIVGSGIVIRQKKIKLFDIESILIEMRNFLSLPKGTRILFSFNNPDREYEKVFDGYRVLLEVPFLVASEKEIHLFPDWWAVSQTNYEGAPTLWGRSIEEIENNLNYWNTEYVIVYGDTQTELNTSFLTFFTVINSFDWGLILPNFEKLDLLNKSIKAPKWWLLRHKIN